MYASKTVIFKHSLKTSPMFSLQSQLPGAEKPLSFLKPGIKPATEIFKYAISASNKATGV